MRKLLLQIFSFLAIFSFAQPVEPGAKAAALGGSFVTQQSVFSAKHNVAGLAFLTNNAVAFGLRNNYFVNHLNDFYFASAFAKGKNCIAIDALYFGFDAYQQVELGASYALALNKSWSVGARLRYAYNYIPPESVSRNLVSADLGILGKLNNWRIGFSLVNFAQSKWQGRVVESEPLLYKIGGGYYFTDQTAITSDFIKKSNAKADVRVGFNYNPAKNLDLRFGFSVQHPSVNFGLGLDLKQFQLNFAIAWHQQLGLSPVTDVVYAW